MTMTAVVNAVPPPQTPKVAPANTLKQQTVAVRLSFHWLGVRAKMEGAMHTAMAAVAEADPDSINASKKLYNLSLQPIKEINALKTQIKLFVEANTLPYVEPGVRLLNRDSLQEFNERMQELQGMLHELAATVQQWREPILQDAMTRLQKAYNPANYPQDLSTLFSVEWSFPSVEPPSYLEKLCPALYEQEKQRVQARFDEAVNLAEQAFLHEFQQLVGVLHERLTPGPDGVKKKIHESAVQNLTDFFTKFQKLNLTNNQELETLVNEAKALTAGVDADDLRKSAVLRNEIAQDLSKLKEKITPLVVNKPRRSILKPQKEEAP